MDLTYSGNLIRQRKAEDTPRFFAFYAMAKEIISWSGISRTAHEERGTQRVLNPARTQAVSRYLNADAKNTLPGCIIIGFRGNSISLSDEEGDLNRCEQKLKRAELKITYDETTNEYDKPGLIVDGQHRLMGALKYEEENIPLLCVAIIDSSFEEEAFQFIVINQKSSKVKTTNIKSILADVGEDECGLIERLTNSGIRYGDNTPTLTRLNSDPESPFYKMIDWEINDPNRDPEASQIVTITAIEASIKQIQSKFENYLADRDTAETVFMETWNTLKKIYPELWNGEKGNKFLTKVNIVTLNAYLVHDLLLKWARDEVDPLISVELEKYLLKTFEPIPKEFWTSKWSIKVQDNSNVRDTIKSDLETIMVNAKLQKAWNEGLKLISADSVDDES